MSNGQLTGLSEGDAKIGAANIRWRRCGNGPALVFLHGFPLSGRTWDDVVARLHDRFTCYTLDLVGLGGSHSTDGDDHASPGQARAFQATLRHLGVETYALIGNDTGGWIARELALVDKPRVTHLVLTNTEIPYHRPPWIPVYQTLAHLPGYGVAMRALLRSRAFLRSPLAFGGCFHDLGRLDGNFHRWYVEPLIEDAKRTEGALEFLRRMKFKRLDEFGLLHSDLTMPTLFVWAKDDPTFPIALARRMTEQFPNVAGFHEIANAKLFLYEERPQEVATLIDRFLSQGR